MSHHLAKIGAFTDELVEAVTDISNQSDRERFRYLRDYAYRNLRQHNFLRTNQFDVDKQLRGLEERFRVHHREALADALGSRLDALEKVPSKWHPDILHLLLELSDQPTQKTDPDDVALLNQTEEDPGASLTWEDIAREEGWHNDPDLWKTVSFSDSSDDGFVSGSEESDHTTSSVTEGLPGRRPEDLVVTAEDSGALEHVQESQAWRLPEARKDADGRLCRVAVTELQIVRDVLFMLHGLETSLFRDDVVPDPAYQMENITGDTHKALIGWFAEGGRQLSTLRAFAAQTQVMPMMQVFHRCVETSLRDFDRTLSSIQSRLAAPPSDTVVSLIPIQQEIKPLLEPLCALSNIARQLDESNKARVFRYLELLYEEIGVAQSIGKPKVFEHLGRIFSECFQVYLRPIRLWMQEGELLPGDKAFFVSRHSAEAPLSEIWQSRFKLRKTAQGDLFVPSFLRPRAANIFTAGKSIVVLKHLGKFDAMRRHWDRPEPSLDFSSICPPGLDLAPFSDAFSSAFDAWIESKHHTTSEALKKVLFETCGLQANIDALSYLYLMADGSAADAFCQSLFSKMDAQRTDWYNRSILTGVMQEAFASVPLESQRITAEVSSAGRRRVQPGKARSFVRTALPAVGVSYRLPWSIQLIVSSEAVSRYQAMFTLLLQLRRAASSLVKYRHRDNLGRDDHRWALRAPFYDLRSRLLWFCNCFQTYLTTLVLGPSMDTLRGQLQEARDIDAMIEIHAAITKSMLDAGCLGPKLDPIRIAMLDILDLALRLDRVEMRRVAEEVSSSSSLRESRRRPGSRQTGSRGQYGRDDDNDDDDENDKSDDEMGSNKDESSSSSSSSHAGASHNGKEEEDLARRYSESIAEIRYHFDRHLRFITGGLRGVARASSEEAGSRWDMLAEMLETGMASGVTSEP